MQEKISDYIFNAVIVAISAILAVRGYYEKRMRVAEKKIEFIKETSLESIATAQRAEKAANKAEKTANEAKADIKFFVQEIKHELSEQTILISNLVEKIETERTDLIREIAKIERLDAHISKMVDIIDKKLT